MTLPAPIAPMLNGAGSVPEGAGWGYEFNWDFCTRFRRVGRLLTSWGLARDQQAKPGCTALSHD